MTSRQFKLVAISIALLFIYACSHPIEIVGQGDVTSASGNRNCYLEDFQAANDKCTKNLVIRAYHETYFAKARPGWKFDHWVNCATATPPKYDCRFNVRAAAVKDFWGQTMPPLKAVFTPCAPGTAGCEWQPNSIVAYTQVPGGSAIVALAIDSASAAAGNIEAGMQAFVAGNFEAAVSAFSKAAEQGDANAQRKLGGMYFMGKGVPQDLEQAEIWWRKAAEQGDAGAQVNLANMYAGGVGVPQDYTQAASWYQMAAEQGDANAQHHLGFAYRVGRGVPQDSEQAVSWYRKAAEQGYADAQYDLGYSYVRSEPKDYVQALKWYILAAAGGNKRAAEMQNLLAGFLKPAAIAEAKKLASEWKPSAN